jgi:hypothetical protein
MSDSTTFNVTVRPVNHPPVLDPISPLSVQEGSLLTFDAKATDLDVPAQTITYSLGSGAPSGAAIGPHDGHFTWTPDAFTGSGNYAITIVATDNGSPALAGSLVVDVNVSGVNHAPVLAPIAAQTVNEGNLVTANAHATDPDLPAQVITYSLGTGAPSGARIDARSGTFSWTPDPYAGSGNYAISIIATDSGSPPLSDSTTFTLTVLAVNHQPGFSDIPPQFAEPGQTMSLGIASFVSDLDRPPQLLRYRLVAEGAAGSSIDPASGAFTWAVPSSLALGTYAFSVVASDNGSPPLSTSQTFLVQVVSVNHPPVLAAISPQEIDEGNELTLTAQATDSDLPPQTITYSLGPGAPTGARIDPHLGIFTWTPDPYAGSGTYSITIVATDNGGVPKSDSKTFSVNVLAVNHPPVIAPIPAQTVASGQMLKIGLAGYVSDLDRPAQTLRYTLVAGGPAGSRIDPASGLYTWTPSASQHIGKYSFVLVVTDNGSPSMQQMESFTVNLVDTSPATISKAKVNTARGLTITLTFSQPLDPATAADSRNYILLAPPKPKKKGSRAAPGPPTPINLTVRYNRASNSVTLTAKGRPSLKAALQLTVIGAGPHGIAKLTGLPLAGHGGKPGTNYVASVTATKIKQVNAT